MDIQQKLQRAMDAHQAGKLAEAAQLYRDVLTIDPKQHVVLYMLGLTELGRGNQEQGIARIREALLLRPDWPEALYDLGIALQAQGKLDVAIDCYRTALQLNTSYYEAHHNLGAALEAQGKLDEAVASYRHALGLNPGSFETHYNLGVALKSQGKLDEAVAAYRCALKLNADHPETHNNLGVALQAQGKLDEAVASYHSALKLKPNYPEAHNNLGTALETHGMLDEAIANYRLALIARPDDPEFHNNLGNALEGQGKWQEACDAYQRAFELKPDYAGAHFNYSTLLLLLGRLEAGWPEYEWRWKTKQLIERTFSQPQWDGSSLGSRTILLHAEQGLGDMFQFIRYAAVVKKQNPTATVILECQRQLVQVLARCAGIDYLIGYGSQLPPFDVHLPLLSLPRIIKTTLETIPARIPYVFADDVLVEHWRHWLDRCRGLRIGINWAGRSGPGQHLKRDIPMSLFAALAEQVPGISLISLQKGSAASDLSHFSVEAPILDPGPEIDTTNGPFMDTAAIMMNLDLVVTSDTAVAHLAGALGVPVWVALPFAPNWRWLLDRSDSPWYPTMRLFRQKKAGDWPGVFEEMAVALRQRLS
jgi:tetratricopeptide (TPR) repeat protein